MKNKYLSYLIRFVITIGIFFALFKLIPYSELSLALKNSHKGYIVLGLGLFLLCNIIGVFRWRFMLSSLGMPVPVSEAFTVYFSGLFLNLFFPSFVAGDVFRGATISSRYGDGNKIASSVLMDRFSGLLALALVAGVGFAFGSSKLLNNQVIVSLSLLWGLTLVFSASVFSRRIFAFIFKPFKDTSSFKIRLVSFHKQLYFFRENPSILVKSMVFSLPIQLVSALSFYASAKAFSISGMVYKFLMIVPIIASIATVPITIAGAGTREAAAVYYFAIIGIEKSIGLSISLLNLVAIVFVGIIGGLVYAGFSHRWVQPRS